MFDNLADQKRIQFVLECDGHKKAVFFARQCVNQYRNAVLSAKRKFNQKYVYREAYIRSYLFHKNWLKTQVKK